MIFNFLTWSKNTLYDVKIWPDWFWQQTGQMALEKRVLQTSMAMFLRVCVLVSSHYMRITFPWALLYSEY